MHLPRDMVATGLGEMDLLNILEQTIEEVATRVGEQLAERAETAFGVAGADKSRRAIMSLLRSLQDDLRSGGHEKLRSSLSALPEIISGAELNFHDLRLLSISLRAALVHRLSGEPALVLHDWHKLEEWFHQLAFRIGLQCMRLRDQTIDKQATELEIRIAEVEALNREQQRLLEMMRQVAIPIAPVHEGVLAVPLVGAIDTDRAQLLTHKVLEAVSQQRCRFVILDITGVPVFDTASAKLLLSTAQAVHLLGAEVVLVGMSAEVAKTIAQLGIGLEGVTTLRSLQDGIAFTQRQLRVPATTTR